MDKNNDNKVKITIVQGVEGKSCYINDRRVCGPKPWGGGKVLYEADPYLSDMAERMFREHSELIDSNPWYYVPTDGYPPERLYNKPLLASDGKEDSYWIDYFNGQDSWKSGNEIEYWMEIPNIPNNE